MSAGLLNTAGAAPESELLTWHSIDWKRVWATIRRLQARIVQAVRVGRWGKVKALVYLLTHSFAGRAAAILRVTTNSGASTPGVDGVLWNTPERKATAFVQLRRRGYQAQPLRRVYIPKKRGQRPLGIPTLRDRAMQALYLLGFDPIEETLADRNSYGFRTGRRCADAMDQVHRILGKSYGPEWIFEGDIKSCFDRINHDWLLQNVPMARRVLQSWLKAGFLEKHIWHATSAGTPQGGIASPALANRTLDGLERMLNERFMTKRSDRHRNKVHLIRYADDFLITGTSKELLREEVQPLVEHFLQERGLELSHEKTSITHIANGFDFLGQNVRRFDRKVLLQPSKSSVREVLGRVDEEIRKHGGHSTAGQLIERLNPILRGWAYYHCHISSASTFARIDDKMYHKMWRWARRRHRKKSARWVRRKYFTESWHFQGVVWTKKGSMKRVTLFRTRTVKIVRHVMIRHEANPYDPSWQEYYARRRGQTVNEHWSDGSWGRKLWHQQSGECPNCAQPLEPGETWHQHHVEPRSRGGSDKLENLKLLHPNCHRQIHAGLE